MTLDRDTVVVRLGLMNDLLGDLESVGSVDAVRLRSDRMARHAVERILTQLVEFAVSINSHIAAAVSGSFQGLTVSPSSLPRTPGSSPQTLPNASRRRRTAQRAHSRVRGGGSGPRSGCRRDGDR